MKRLSRPALAVLLCTLLGVPACRRSATPTVPVADPASPVEPDPAAATPAPVSPSPVNRWFSSAPSATPVRSTPAPPAALWNSFSGERAMAEVAKQVDLGPRPAGSPEAAQARTLITEGLKRAGWRVEEQAFSDETPRGSVRFINLIAHFGQPPKGLGTQAIVCSHYDTKRFSTIRFVGASDGASSTGALIELARVLALDPALAARVELVFFDGEEAVQQFTDTDGLYGSRYYARTLRETGRAEQFKFGILWDMIGDRDLTITLPPDSPAELAKGIFASAQALGSRQAFSFLSRQLLDDHVPIQRAGVPSIDLIDFDYLPWHTADDTLDKLSPASLQTVGAVTVHFLKQAFPH